MLYEASIMKQLSVGEFLKLSTFRQAQKISIQMFKHCYGHVLMSLSAMLYIIFFRVCNYVMASSFSPSLKLSSIGVAYYNK